MFAKSIKVFAALFALVTFIPMLATDSPAKEKKLEILYSSSANGFLLPCG